MLKRLALQDAGPATSLAIEGAARIAASLSWNSRIASGNSMMK